VLDGVGLSADVLSSKVRGVQPCHQVSKTLVIGILRLRLLLLLLWLRLRLRLRLRLLIVRVGHSTG
jgi:hypothetical protein